MDAVILGYAAVAASVASFTIANILLRHAKAGGTGLFTFQYAGTTLYSFVYALVLGLSLPVLDSAIEFAWFLFIGLIGYAGIYFFVRSLATLGSALTTAISYGYVFVAFALNRAIFGDAETFSVSDWIFLAVFFSGLFVSVGGHLKKRLPVRAFLLPFGAAIFWGMYYAVSNYAIKSGLFDTASYAFVTEWGIFLFALVFAFLDRKIRGRSPAELSPYSAKMLLASALGVVFGVAMLGVAYDRLPGNTVNVLSLSVVCLVPLFSALFFGEKPSWTEGISLVLCAVGIIGFAAL